MRIFRNQRGDTILEVLIAVAVLSLILTTAFVLANRSSQSNQQAAERGEAYKITQSEMELLKSRLGNSDISDLPGPGSYFCFLDNGDIYEFPGSPTSQEESSLTGSFYSKFNPGEAAADCKSGLGGYYHTYIYRGTEAEGLSNTFTAHTKWPAVTGNGVDKVELIHRVYPDTVNTFQTLNTPSTPVVGGGGGGGGLPVTPPNPVPPAPVTPPTPCPAGFSGRQPNCVRNPLVASISPASRTYPAWHLYAATGSPHSQVFTITGQSNSGPLQLTSVTLSGSHANSFQITQNNCTNRILTGAQSCTVTVIFFPPAGGALNRLGNAGNRSAILTINNSSGVAPRTAALSGETFSDRMLPGDTMQMGQQIKSYTQACHNNAAACPTSLVLQGDTNFVLYGPSGYRWCTCTGAEPSGTVVRAVMQGDGHLVIYRQNNSVVWASHNNIGGAYMAGDWLIVYESNSALNLMRSNGAPYYNISPWGAFY